VVRATMAEAEAGANGASLKL
jgi:hypothetical protein